MGNKCKFSHLVFGEVVSISRGDSICGNCGFGVGKEVASTKWIYQGHSINVCMFVPVDVIYCPSCRKKIDGIYESCTGEDYTLPTIDTHAELPRKTERKYE